MTATLEPIKPVIPTIPRASTLPVLLSDYLAEVVMFLKKMVLILFPEWLEHPELDFHLYQDS
jgi:hypothetical protein